MNYDVIIIGGSYAGLSGGLQLARARRSVLVVDSGMRRNRFAGHSHGFLTNDGVPAAEIALKGKEQLLRYKTVEWLDDEVKSAETTGKGFKIKLKGNEDKYARRLILATGVRDKLPDIPGLQERWGKSVFHCPYCHGYELNQGNIGIIASSSFSVHLGQLLPDWGPTTFFVNGYEINEEEISKLENRGVKVEHEKIAGFEGENANVRLADGRVISLAGMFVKSELSIHSPLAEQLGCETEKSPWGTFIKTNEMKLTSVTGVYACGDNARMAGTVALAVADGAIAGSAAHQSLVFEQ